jgi:CRP/FNR family cyclic AMP-dependent transcriptional regulator
MMSDELPKTQVIMDEPLKRFSRIYKTGEVVFSEGDSGTEMYIIQKGKVRVSKNFAGKQHVLAILEKGDFFGEMAIVNLMSRTATITAIDSVVVLAFDREGLLNMITKNAKVGLSIIDKLCRRLRNADLKIQHLVKKDEEGLIALHLHTMFQALPEGESTIPLAKVLDDITLTLELPREDVAGILDKIKASGIIQVDGDAVRVLDHGKLLTLSG